MKKILSLLAALLFAAGLLAGCTPRAITLWCAGLGEGERFSLEYPAANHSYDGQNCSFVVRDREDFSAFLCASEGYAGMCGLADGTGEAFLFFRGENGYFCAESGTAENAYRLTPCALMAETEEELLVFAYPPADEPYVFAEGHTFAVSRGWDHFADFYVHIPGAAVDAVAQTVTTACYRGFGEAASGTVTLAYAEGEISYVFSGHE